MKTNHNEDKAIYDKWHNDPANWKLGFLYFNPKDKRLFPPKRLRFGFTINFANPLSIITMLLLVVALHFAIQFLISATS